LSNALSIIYPEVKWQYWRFSYLSKNFWEKEENVRDYFQWLFQQLQMNTLDDWYRISLHQIMKLGPITSIKKYGGLPKVLSRLYPTHQWNIEKFYALPKASQRMLKLKIQGIFPNSVIHEDFIHSELLFDNGRSMQLDIFIPELCLAFEYQGKHHYYNLYFIAPVSHYMKMDEQKRVACK